MTAASEPQRPKLDEKWKSFRGEIGTIIKTRFGGFIIVWKPDVGGSAKVYTLTEFNELSFTKVDKKSETA